MQGFNQGRYVPPDLEGTTTGNQLHGRRAPGVPKKDGTQTVRFEMPFAVWCHTCSPHAIIGQGVRFNAEKRRVGKYYSTPIWGFRMKHPACGGWIEIRTDPKETRYVVVDGGRARDYGESKADEVREGEGGIPILTEQEREERRENAFAALEGRVEEKRAAEDSAKRIVELYRAKERDWEDTWNANQRVRESFRRERKVRKREEESTEALKKRLGTDIDLLPENEEDARRAKLVVFGGVGENANSDGAARNNVDIQTTFKSSQQLAKLPTNSKSRRETTQKANLQRQLLRNTRATMNPFG